MIENNDSLGVTFTAEINTWCRKYRRKDLQKSTETDDIDAQEGSVKRQKMLPFLVVSLILYDYPNKFNVGIVFREGTGGRDAVNSFLQFLCNLLKK